MKRSIYSLHSRNRLTGGTAGFFLRTGFSIRYPGTPAASYGRMHFRFFVL